MLGRLSEVSLDSDWMEGGGGGREVERMERRWRGSQGAREGGRVAVMANGRGSAGGGKAG